MNTSRLCQCIVLCSLMGGCASYMTVMQNPETGDIEECESAGAGLIPMVMAESQHDDCVRQLRGLGYQPVPGSDAAN